LVCNNELSRTLNWFLECWAFYRPTNPFPTSRFCSGYAWYDIAGDKRHNGVSVNSWWLGSLLCNHSCTYYLRCRQDVLCQLLVISLWENGTWQQVTF